MKHFYTKKVSHAFWCITLGNPRVISLYLIRNHSRKSPQSLEEQIAILDEFWGSVKNKRT